MIDPSIYDLTEETARYILNHWEIVFMFYFIGIISTAFVLVNVAIKGLIIIINKIKNKRTTI